MSRRKVKRERDAVGAETGMRNVQSYATKLFTCGKHAVDGIAKDAYFTAENIRQQARFQTFCCRAGEKL